MTSEPRHLKEELQELLDGCLSAESRLEVKDHLKYCEECSRELKALRWTKQFVRQTYAAEPVPAKLEENILAALDLEDRLAASHAVRSWNWWPPRRSIPAYGFLLCVAITVALSYFIFRKPLGTSPELAHRPELSSPETSRPEPAPNPELATPELSSKPELPARPKLPEKPKMSAKPKLPVRPQPDKRSKLGAVELLPAKVARDYRGYEAEKLPLLLQTADVTEMEKFFAAEGITFETRVFDLAMMNYRLEGGRVHRLDGRKSALFVYRGKGNEILICQMYQGHVTELPASAVVRQNKGIHFYIYRINGITTIFWQEGAVTCVLASNIDTEKLVALAFAKAVKI